MAPRSSSCLLSERATGGPAASRCAQSSTKASSSSCGTTRLTRPMRSASAASSISASKTSSFALCSPSRRGRTQEPPKSMLSPRRAKISEKRARSDATIRSQPRARLSPAPAATPLTFAMSGLEMACSAAAVSWMPPDDLEHRLLAAQPAADVGARAERVARTGDDADAAVALLELGECVAELGEHGQIHRVLAVGTRQGDGRDPVRRSLQPQSFVAHARSVPDAVGGRPLSLRA